MAFMLDGWQVHSYMIIPSLLIMGVDRIRLNIFLEKEFFVYIHVHLQVTVSCLGPLHKRVKSRDHEIVRAQKKIYKGHPKTLSKSCRWSQTLKCSVKSHVIAPSTKCYFKECPSKQVLAVAVVSVQSATVFRFCFRPTSKRWFLKIAQETMKQDPFDDMKESM